MTSLYQGHQSSSRMFVGAMVVAGFHLVALLVFKSGLIQDIMPVVFDDPLITFAVPPDKPPPPPQAQEVEVRQELLEPHIPYVPPDIVIEQPATASPVTVVEAPAASREVAIPAPSGEGPRVVDFQVDSRYPLTRPEYPPPERRLGHEGLVTLKIYVLPSGRVGEANIAVSSGFPRLDDAARREALKSWRFKPRTENGVAAGSWGTYRVRFSLDDL